MAARPVSGGRFAVAVFVLLALLGSASTDALAACPNEASPGFRAYLPDCRAYELVSPAYKEGFQVEVTGVSEDGSRVLAQSFGSFSGTEDTGALGQPYELVRTDMGWESLPLDEPFSEISLYSVQTISPDFQGSLWSVHTPVQPLLEYIYRGPPKGPLTRVGPAEPPGVGGEVLAFAGASDDLSHVIYIDRSPGGGEVSHLWPGDTTAGGRLPSLYEYAGFGSSEPRLVGVNDVGMPPSIAASHLISNCGTYIGSDPEGEAYNAISESGAAVFFTAASGVCGASGPPVNELYARIDGEKSVAISEPALSVPGRECTGACAAAENEPANRRPGVFAGASLNGSRVFFMTQQSLVNGDEGGGGSGMDLYEAEIEGEGENARVVRLVQVSRGGEGDPTPGSGAEVLGVARVSEDGSHVYYVAKGVLTGRNREGNAPAARAPNLYMFSSECPGGDATCGSPVERTSFVATLSSTRDEKDWSSDDARPVQATPEGDFLVFQSTADLTYDQEGREEAGQVFEYDAQTETLARVSRSQGGYNEDGNSRRYPATIPAQGYEGDSPDQRFTYLTVSADGSRVFFSSEDALTPQTSSGVNNVYEYHNGQVGLISDGHDTVSTLGQPAVELIGTDESGLDVLFMTADRLVPQDNDNQTDLYDARIDGGFASPASPAECSADSCQAAVSEPLPLLAPYSTSVVAEAGGVRVVSGSAPSKPIVVKKKVKRRTRAVHKPRTRRSRKMARRGK